MATIPVVSQQSGTASWSSGTASLIIVLPTAVDETHSIITFSSKVTSADPGDTAIQARILAGGTQAQFEVIDAAPVTKDLSWIVTEFDSTVNVQTIEVLNIGGPTPLDTAISTVDLTRTIVIPSGYGSGGTIYGQNDAPTAYLTSSTNLRWESDTTNAPGYSSTHLVVEFPADAVASVQLVNTGAVTGANEVVAISSVDTAKSLIFASCTMSGNFGMDDVYRASLVSSTTIELDRVASGGVAANANIYVIEFSDYDTVHGTIASTALTESHVLASTPVNGDVFLNSVHSLNYMLGSTDTNDQLSTAAWRSVLVTDTITFTRNSLASNSTISFSFIDWGQTSPSTALIVQNLVSGTAISSPALLQNNALAVDGLAVATTISEVLFVQNYFLDTDDIAVDTSISVVDFVSHQSILSDDLSVATLISEPVFVQQNVLDVDSQAVATTISAPDLIQQNILAVDSQAVATEISEVSLAENADLIVQDLSVTTTISNAELIENFVLNVDSLNVATLIDNVDFVQHNILAVNDMAVATQLSEAGLLQHNLLAVNSVLVDTSLSNVSLSSAGDLGVNDLTSATTISEPDLVQQQILVVDGLAVGTAITQSIVESVYSLLVENMTVSTSISVPTLQTGTVLLVDDMSISTLLSSVTFDGAVLSCLNGEVVIASLLDGTVTIQSVLSGEVTILNLLDGTVTIQ